MICSACVTKLEEFDNFRNLCLEAEKMLCDFRAKLKTTTVEPDGKVLVAILVIILYRAHTTEQGLIASSSLFLAASSIRERFPVS